MDNVVYSHNLFLGTANMDKDYSKIILTGGTGWLGGRLATLLTQRLAELGFYSPESKDIRCLVQSKDEAKELLALGVDVIYGDISDINACIKLMRGFENSLVIHTAGLIHPRLFTKDFSSINFSGAMNLLHAATTYKASRMIFLSSNSPLGFNLNPEHRFTESSQYNPYMMYGKSKHMMEKALLNVIKSSGYPEVTIIRSPWFYGPGQPPRQTEFFRMVKNGRFPLMGKGLAKRSMAYIDSLVSGILLAGYSAKAAGEIYWIADERPYSILEIVDTVKTVLSEDFGFNVNPKNLYVPSTISDIARVVDGSLQAIGLYNQKIHVLSEMNQTIACDISKASLDLGYEPLCELREGMRRSVDWCLKNGQVI